MLTTACIHPQLLEALSRCGHGDKIIIADGNYPLDSRTGTASKVYLGLTGGVPSSTQVLEVLCKVIAVERAEVMTPDDGQTPDIFHEFSSLLDGMELETMERYAFYEACCAETVRLAISTGETRTYANILLTVGVVEQKE